MVGQQVRVTTITGAVWPGKLSEVDDDRLVIQGAGGAFTISRAAVRSIEPLNNTLRARSAVAMDGAAAQPDGGDVRIHGSNTIGAQMGPNLIEAFGQATGRGNVSVVPGRVGEERKIVLAGADPNRAVNVELHSHGSGTAFTSLATKAADLGMASRPVNDKEREAVMAAGMGDLRSVGQEHVIGLDGLSVIVNQGNPLSSLTVAQIAAIFTGGVTDWAEIGGRPDRIEVYARDVKSGTFDTFNELVLRRRALAQGTRSFESSTELSDDVAADPNGIGFVGLAYIRAARAVSVVQACGLAVPADPFTVRTEEYPLARRLFIYSPAEPTRIAASFLAFAGSAEAQPVVSAAGFVNLSPELSAVAYNEFRKRTAPEFGSNAYSRDGGLAGHRPEPVRLVLGGTAALHHLPLPVRQLRPGYPRRGGRGPLGGLGAGAGQRQPPDRIGGLQQPGRGLPAERRVVPRACGRTGATAAGGRGDQREHRRCRPSQRRRVQCGRPGTGAEPAGGGLGEVALAGSRHAMHGWLVLASAARR